MDGIHYKVMHDRISPGSHVVFNVPGLTAEGRRDMPGMHIAKSEGANFRMSVLTDFQNPGGGNILIASGDGLKGFPDAVACVFPLTTGKLSCIHQIPSLRCAIPNDSDLEKLVYPVYTPICHKWMMQMPNSGQTVHQLARAFGDRFLLIRFMLFLDFFANGAERSTP